MIKAGDFVRFRSLEYVVLAVRRSRVHLRPLNSPCGSTVWSRWCRLRDVELVWSCSISVEPHFDPADLKR